MILKALRLSMTMFRLRFTTHFLISMAALGVLNPSFASSQWAHQQPSYGDNPNLIRVLFYKGKQKLMPSQAPANPPIHLQQGTVLQQPPKCASTTSTLDQHIVSLPLSPQNNDHVALATPSQTQEKTSSVQLVDLSRHNMILANIVDSTSL